MSESTLDAYLQYMTGTHNVREFLLEDDHLLHNPEWTLTVCNKLQKYGLPWMEEGGVGLFNLIALLPEVDEEYIKQSTSRPGIFNKTLNAKRKGITAEQIIKAMADSGCYSIYLAVESANSESLYSSKKPTLNVDEKHTRQIIGLFNKYGIKTTCGLMLGFLNPHFHAYVETRENIARTIQYGQILKQAGATYINPFIFTPLPGASHFDGLANYIIPNTDEGFSHEFGTINAPNGEWTRDELSLLRVYSIIKTNGLKGYSQILKTGTWPVDTKPMQHYKHAT